MKTKLILIVAIVVLVVAASCFAFIKYKNHNRPGKSEIIQFLNAFNKHIQAGDIDSARTYFEDQQQGKAVKILLNVLANKTNTGGKDKPLFKLSMNTEDALVKVINPEFATALVVTRFNHEDVAETRSTILFTIHKTDAGQYKITQVDAKTFVQDYVAFQNKIFIKITPEKDIYSPITLAAFKTAEQLKTRYDSVLWFDHVNQKTFYYVIKGKMLSNYFWLDKMEPAMRDTAKKSDFKMGLISPDLKEIIPVEYDLVHNIGGTIDSMIEVEKGDKRGLYTVDGKLVVPVEYDQIYPLKSTDNLALLKNGDDYFYFKADFTISEKINDFKIADALPMIKAYGSSFTLSEKSSKDIMEYNSRDKYTSLVVSPAYLKDWNMVDRFLNFQNPLRKLSEETMGDGDGSKSLSVEFLSVSHTDSHNWFESAFYTVVDDYLGGRSGLYTTKNLLFVDKKHNQVMGFSSTSFFGNAEGGGNLSGTCKENSLKAVNDSLFEFKTASEIDVELFDSTKMVTEAPYYHYLKIEKGKLVPLQSKRLFPTQFVKMDDSYLQGCYIINSYNNNKSSTLNLDYTNKEMLQVMKNEIYASYNYQFKNPRWNRLFSYRYGNYGDKLNTSVDDSLTTIDKYNIAFINSKLNGKPLNVKMPNSLAAR